MALVADLADVARKTAWWDDTSVRHELARVSAELDAQWAYTKRNVSRAARYGNTGVGGSIFKLGWVGSPPPGHVSPPVWPPRSACTAPLTVPPWSAWSTPGPGRW